MGKNDKEKSNWGTICPLVEMEAADGRKRKIQAADTKGLLRIIQSIPSPKAAPFKLWLAQVGSDRLDEIENPELATQRTRELCKLKGYSDDWIVGSHVIINTLRFIRDNNNYPILGTFLNFDKTPESCELLQRKF